MMKIYIGADHRGYKLKEEIQKYLEKKDYQVIDKGAFKLIPDDDYPDYAFSVAEAVTKNKGSKGILLCGSSNGVNVSANKVKGIFSSEVRSAEEAKEDIKHHNSDVLALSADNLNIDQMKEILDVWLTTEFEGGRHKRRLNKIWDYENKTHQQANCYVPTVKGLLIILLFILLLGLFASIDLVSPVFKNIDNKVDVTDLLQNDVEIQSSVEEIIIRSSCNNQLKTTGEKCYSDINYALGYANGDIRITIADAQYATSIIMRPYSAITNRLEPNSKECWKLKDPNNPSLGYHDLCDQGDRCGTTTTAPCACATADSSLEGYDSAGKIKPGAICPRNVWANGIKDSVKAITISGRDNNKTLFPYPSSTANGFAIDIDGLKDVNISISNLTIRGVTVTNQRAAIAVGAASNNVKLELSNVSIDSIGGNGILIMGNNSLEARDINMKNMLKSAIELSNTAKANILNIELAANKDSAINLLDSSTLLLNNAFVIDSGVAGIVFKGNSKGEIYDSVFKNNANFNVGVIDNAEVLFRNSVVDGVNNRNHGFLIDNTAKIDIINALVINTNKTLDIKSNQTRGNIDYNLFYRNTVRVISDDARFPIKNNILDRDPLVNSNYLLSGSSPMINSGDPNVKDGDNSRSDIGLFGGPTQNLFVGNKYNTDGVNKIVLDEAGGNPTPTPQVSPTPTPYPNGCGYPSSFSSADFNSDRKVDITDFVCFIEEYRRRR
ncbi:RpiB/LacA/LacB family sugar-phosphate isomerase [Candidatus Dojkabacteria bacterium]|nr:RpiB/LacA/LacB family sugar-phosphate isomerase [Candidatus Dojkabacteria bacterium]